MLASLGRFVRRQPDIHPRQQIIAAERLANPVCASARFSQGNSDHRSDELWTLARLWPCAARQREPSPTRATASTAEWSSMTLAANSPRSAQLHSIYVFA